MALKLDNGRSNNREDRMNTGILNTGNSNSGNINSGDKNSGDRNLGDYNSGNCNRGNHNSGYCNWGNYNTGIFNTEIATTMAFNIPWNMTIATWKNDETFIDFDVRLIERIGNILTERAYKEAWAEWWIRRESPRMTERIRALPNFDSAIFKEITGISINASDRTI